ncbi:negative cofactor 2 transcription regulator complex subunit ncb2 [Coniosporium tulheliwenetii]|uniref:Negative cofactor 2 transcription regulator complex subunit ncb2 n=1 Tax=Coniosporium tulheliwenetii TaxID=3383036 RepID=A0ACC2ZDS5_9PEZI|nr:negative cofactor 2 transcription regulator complex subunit ncb2 [Cladosporium sp. JES 115]
MSDREFGATVDKIVKEILQNEPGMTFGKDTRDLLIECCVEFLTLVSSESNEIAEKDAKKTIGYEHVKQALEDLGFGDMVPHIAQVASEFKDTQAKRERKQTKIEQSGMTEEELVRMQQELFRSATEKFNAGPQESTEGS